MNELRANAEQNSIPQTPHVSLRSKPLGKQGCAINLEVTAFSATAKTTAASSKPKYQHIKTTKETTTDISQQK